MTTMPPTDTQYFPLVGGLDVDTAQLQKEPGRLMGGYNFESLQSTGYERIGAYERFDGRPRPSDASYKLLAATAGFSGVVVGDTINGQTSGATAKIIQIRSATQLVVTRVTGTFTVGENIRVVTTVKGVYTGDVSGVTGLDDNAFSALAAADYRTDIGAVPGGGPIRGVAMLNSVVYAWRDNASSGATSCGIYKSTSAGWVLVPMQREVSFTAGSGTPPAEGATITKGVASAVLRRIMLQSGTWAGGTAAGRFLIDNVTGGAFSAGAFTAGVTATCSGADTAVTLLPGGRVDHRVYNFTGSLATERIYACDGVNRGFEFDGTYLAPIVTGMSPDTPRHVECHKNHLFFSFKGSVQNSAIQAPFSWTVVTGANEIATGQDVTGFSSVPGDATSAPLIVYSDSRSLVIYGTSAADWKPTPFNDKIGAQRWSMQNIGNPVVMNTLGITPVVQSQEFGNFTMPPSSDRIRSYLKGRVVTASVVNRNNNRMRIFYADGTGVSVTAGAENMLRFMPLAYGKVVRCATEASVNSVSRIFFGSDDGYIYETDVGRSFDGGLIESFVKLAFNHTKTPNVRKRFRGVTTEVSGQSVFSLSVQAEFSLGAIDIKTTPMITSSVAGSGGQWDVSNWDQAYYDAASQTNVNTRLDGEGTSMSLTYYSRSASELPYILQSTTTRFTKRRQERLSA